jgi:hypothetical protein
MENATPREAGTHIGVAQVDNGLCWVLSVYEQEISERSNGARASGSQPAHA